MADTFRVVSWEEFRTYLANSRPGEDIHAGLADAGRVVDSEELRGDTVDSRRTVVDLEAFRDKVAGWHRERGLPVPPSIPTSVFLPPNEVRECAKERSTAIFSNYEMLKQILERHEDTIRKRWAKKTKTLQRAILLSVWPNMAPFHRPDFEAIKKEDGKDRAAGTRFREWFLWPHKSRGSDSEEKSTATS